MVVRIAPSGGRTRRKGGAISLAGADVPVVTPARDPGLNVPLIPISGGEVEGAIGKGLQSLGNVLDQGVNLALQVVQRDEGLARDADSTSYSDTLQDTVRDLQATADLSDSALVEAVGEKMFQEKQRILSEHKGGKISSTLLGDRLTKMHNKFADTLAVLNINSADVRLNMTIDRKISSITRDVLTDPDVLVSEDPLEAFRFHTGQLEDEIDFLELRPDQARIVRQAGRSEIALTMITPLIKNGQFERAKVLLRSDEMAEVLSPGQHRDAIQRVIDSERKSGEAKSEGQKFLETARLLNPPTATEEEIRATARDLAGLDEDDNIEIMSVGDGKVVAINKESLDVKTLISGPTNEEKITQETAMERARLVARKDVMSSMAIDAGLGQLFGVAPTEPAGGEGEKPKPATAQPTATGEPGAPPGPEVVPPLSEESVVTPFGPEEEPASTDMQSVLGLMALSRRFFLIGDNASANGLLSQARMIIDNSREMQEQKELDKPISNVEMLRELGMPLGATMRQVAGRVLQSTEQLQLSRQRGERIDLNTAREFQVPPNSTRGELDAILADRERSGEGRVIPQSEEERTQALAGAGARGREQVQAEEQLAFIDEARVQIGNLLEEVKDDPTLVGGVGGLRATGRSAITFLEDIGMGNLVSGARELAFENSELGLDAVVDLFDDPTLSSLDILANSTGLILARLRTPAGRIPVELIKLSIKDVGLKGLRGSVVVQDRLNFVLGLLEQRDQGIRKRFPDIPPREDDEIFEEQVIPSDIPEFRLEGGRFVPVIPDGSLGGDSSEIPFSGEVIQGSEGTEELRGEATNLSLEEILVPKAQGESTIDITVAAVDQLFGGGEFLKRVAKVESNFGTDKGTFRKKGDRGIWQLNQKTGFEATKDVESHPGLKRAHEKISEEFGIDWDAISFEDLEKPLISALAARLFLLTIPEEIPNTLEEQAEYWKEHYNTPKGKGTAKRFIKVNKELDTQE